MQVYKSAYEIVDGSILQEKDENNKEKFKGNSKCISFYTIEFLFFMNISC